GRARRSARTAARSIGSPRASTWRTATDGASGDGHVDPDPQREATRMILVTGGAGVIGSNFVLDWLAQSDEPVRHLDQLTYPIADGGGEVPVLRHGLSARRGRARGAQPLTAHQVMGM